MNQFLINLQFLTTDYLLKALQTVCLEIGLSLPENLYNKYTANIYYDIIVFQAETIFNKLTPKNN